MRFLLPPPAPRHPREERARRATEAVLAAGLVASVLSSSLAPRQPPPAAPFADLPIDVARDPPWLLRLLPSIGEAKAEAIAADREKNGPVASVAALRRIRGFGPKSIASLEKAGAVVGPAPAATPEAPAAVDRPELPRPDEPRPDPPDPPDPPGALRARDPRSPATGPAP